jgi:hypothetical protein
MKVMMLAVTLALLTVSRVSACDAIDQQITYPTTIAIAPSSLATFRALKPNATYGVVVIIAYRDGRLTFKTGGHPDFDGAFLASITAFGHAMIVTPVNTSCAGVVAGAWLMIFTIPDGRVIILPIPLPADNAPVPLPSSRVGSVGRIIARQSQDAASI